MAPLITPDTTATISPDSNIIVFKDGFKSSNFSSKSKKADPIQQSHDDNKDPLWGEIAKGIKHSIDLGSFQAVTGRFSDEALTEIRKHPAVAFVERDIVGQRLNNSSSSPSETREAASSRLVFKLAKETQPVPVSTLRSNGNGTVSDFIAVVDYIARNQLMRTNGGGIDEKKVSHDESILSVPFAFTNSRSMILAVTKAFESGLHLALGNGATASNTNVEKL
ncbi:serine protease [Linnemannia elongata]|nr:serine protease [Linnemannia elongata]